MSFKVPEVSIQHKILVGHLILFAIIACIFGILQHERMRISDIEKEARHIQQVQRKVNTAHRHITLLAMLGETAILGRERILLTIVHFGSTWIPHCWIYEKRMKSMLREAK